MDIRLTKPFTYPGKVSVAALNAMRDALLAGVAGNPPPKQDLPFFVLPGVSDDDDPTWEEAHYHKEDNEWRALENGRRFLQAEARAAAGATLVLPARSVDGAALMLLMDQPFPMVIDGATQDGTSKRWLYTGFEVEKTSGGYGGWTELENGRVAEGAGNGVWIFNAIESGNASAGLWGNGVNSTNLVGTFTIQRIPNDRVVFVKTVVVADGTVEYWTQYENGIDGACP